MTPCRCRGVLLYHAECAGFVKMVISASGIFRVEPFQHRLCGDSPSADGGNVPRPAAGQEGRHQGFYPLNSHFLLFVSLAQIRDWRPLRKRRTAEDFYYRRGAQCAPISLPLRSAGFRTATHIGCSTQARHKVNCPKGKRGSPGGYPCRATRLLGGHGRHLRVLFDNG